jgi:hypothetical protein
MVREWGLSAAVGPVGYGPQGSGQNPFAGRLYAEETQRSIDQEVARLLREAEIGATKLLGDHRDILDRVVEILLERETIDGTELAAIVKSAHDRLDENASLASLAVAMTPVGAAESELLRGGHPRASCTTSCTQCATSS